MTRIEKCATNFAMVLLAREISQDGVNYGDRIFRRAHF